jgi:hypothetical protein
VVNSDMGWHAIQLADGTDVRLQTSGIKVLADMETQHDDMGDGTYDNDLTPSRATLVAKGQGKKPALKPAPKPAKSKSAAPHASGRKPSGKKKGGPDTFAQGTQVGVARPSQPRSNPRLLLPQARRVSVKGVRRRWSCWATSARAPS